MLALLFLVAAALTGIAGVRVLARGALDTIEELFVGIVVGWMFATAMAYIAASTADALSFELMLGVTIAMSAAAVVAWRAAAKLRHQQPAESQPGGLVQSRWLIALLAFFLPIYASLFNMRMLQEKADGLYSGGTTYYDLAFHLTVSTSFLYAQNFPPIYTMFPPHLALYPLLPDFLTAALVAGGMTFHAALCVTGVGLAAAVTVLLYAFAVRMSDRTASASQRTGAAALAALLFLLNGGFAFVYFLKELRGAGRPFDYANVASYDIQWTNVIVDSLLPQRASLFGISAGLLVFAIFASAWRRWFDEEAERGSWKPLAAGGVIAGALPFFHAHSYLAVGIVSGLLFLLRPRREWLAFWIPAVLIPLPHLIALAQHATGEGNMRFHPLWLGRSYANWLLVWIKNAGLATILIVPAWFAAAPAWRRFYLAFLGLLVIALFIVFTPNDTDNLKLLLYWYVATCVLVAQWLVRLAVDYRQRALAVLLTAGMHRFRSRRAAERISQARPHVQRDADRHR